jgi:hypothetical protein
MVLLTSVQHPRNITSENTLVARIQLLSSMHQSMDPVLISLAFSSRQQPSDVRGQSQSLRQATLKYIERPNGWLSCAEQLHNMRFGDSPLNGKGTWLCGEEFDSAYYYASSNERRILAVICRAI